MAPGTAFAEWAEALADACKRITDFAPGALVVSLGVRRLLSTLEFMAKPPTTEELLAMTIAEQVAAIASATTSDWDEMNDVALAAHREMAAELEERRAS